MPKWQNMNFLEILKPLLFPPYVSQGCYLYKSGLVTEPVVAILAHAVEVGLVLAVVAVRELAILVEPVGYKNNTDFYHCVSIEKWVDGCGSASEEPRLEK